MESVIRHQKIQSIVVLLIAIAPAQAQQSGADASAFRVLSFNILQGGGNAANVGFSNQDFGGSRYDELASVILQSDADVIGVQEDDRSGRLLTALGKGWTRKGSIYSKYDLTLLLNENWMSVCRLRLPTGKSIVVVNCHWRPSDYGPFQVQDYLRQRGRVEDLVDFEQRILKSSDKTSGDRGYEQTLNALEPFLADQEMIVLTGDFNEPSHLDWTARAAEDGMDRWIDNPTETPLRFRIRWRGSRLLADAGLRDAYRSFYVDEVRHPGNTWTPSYPENSAGRRAYSDQVLDRIDMIYFSGPGLRLRSAAVLGESRDVAEIVRDGRWPSDHRAVLAVFDIVP